MAHSRGGHIGDLPLPSPPPHPAKKLNDVVFPNVHPPPMAKQPQNLGGIFDIVVGAFCEHNDQRPVRRVL
jgi:hypothetical protein